MRRSDDLGRHERARHPDPLRILENRLHLIEALDQRPDRVIPHVPVENRLVFASQDEAREAFLEAISEGDIAGADRVFASTDAVCRITDSHFESLTGQAVAANKAKYLKVGDTHFRDIKLK